MYPVNYAKKRLPLTAAAFLVRESGTMGNPPVMDSAEGGAVGFLNKPTRAVGATSSGLGRQILKRKVVSHIGKRKI